jgi:hypothetical protein
MKRVLPILLILALVLLVLSSLTNINNFEKTGKAATIETPGFIGSQSQLIPEKIPLTEFIDKELIKDDEEYIEEDIPQIEEPIEITSEETTHIGSESNITIQKPKQGFIIELKEEPILKKEISLEKEAKKIEQQRRTVTLRIKSKSKISTEIRVLESKAKTIQNKKKNIQIQLRREHKNALKDIHKIINENPSINKITGNAVADIQPKQEFYYAFNGFSLDISEEQARKIRKSSFVKDIYPDLIVNISLMDSIPLINADQVWQLDQDGNDCSTSGKECITGKDIIIAIVDTGIDYTHSDLGGCLGQGCKVIKGYDFINNDNDPMDDHGHGTHCAGIASADGIVKGVAPDAKLYAYKVLDGRGRGTFSGVMAGIEKAVEDGADIISMSLGGDCRGNYNENCGPDDAVSKTVDNAVNAGIVFSISAGNSGRSGLGTIGTPGTARKAITVAASDKQDKIADFSSKGPIVFPDQDKNKRILLKPDISAPGVDICSSQYEDAWQSNECLDSEHTAISGTSMAAPHVAGAAALIKQAHPDWTADEIKSALKNSAIDINDSLFNQGAGRLDIKKALILKQQPIAHIEAVYKDNEVKIYGTAKANNFIDYKVYQKSEDWIEICSSNNEVEDNLLCSWTPDSAGVIELKLVVNSDYAQTEDITYVMANYSGEPIEVNDDLILDKDIYTPLILKKRNGILDCNNHKINGMFSTGSGIKTGAHGIEIRNCILENWQKYYAIEIVSYHNTTVINSKFKNNNRALHITNYAKKISNITIENNEIGIMIPRSYGISIDNVLIKNNEYGILAYSLSKFKMRNASIENNEVGALLNPSYQRSKIDIDESNKINNKPILYELSPQDKVYEGSNWSTIYVVNGKNLTFRNLTLGSDNYADIYAFYVSKSIFENMSLENSDEGIHLERSSYNTIRNIKFNNINNPVRLYRSPRNTIENLSSSSYSSVSCVQSDYNKIKNLKDIGIYFNSRCSYNEITNSNIENSYGIYLSYESHNNLFSNITLKNGIAMGANVYIYNSKNTTLKNVSMIQENEGNVNLKIPDTYLEFQNIDETNTVNGKPILYSLFEKDKVYQGDKWGVFYIINGSNIKIKDVIPTSNNEKDMFLYNTHDSVLENIEINTTSAYGIYLENSHRNNISNIFIPPSNKYVGIMLSRSNENSITNTDITNSGKEGYTSWGIYLYNSNYASIENINIQNFKYGFQSASSKKVKLRDVSLNNNDFNFIIAYSFDQDIDESNTVQGKPILYKFNPSNEIYEGSRWGTAWIINGKNITLRNIEPTTNSHIDIYIVNNTNILVEDIILSKDYSNNGLIIESSKNAIIRNIKINPTLWNGIYIYYSQNIHVSDIQGDETYIRSNKLNDSIFERISIDKTSSGRPCFWAWYLHNVSVKSFNIKNCGYGGYVEGDSMEFRDGVVSNARTAFVFSQKNNKVFVNNVTLTENDFGIFMEQGIKLEIYNSTFNNHYETAIYIENITANVSNNLFGNNKNSINLQGDSKITVNNNRIEDSEESSFYINSKNSLIYNNIIKGNNPIIFGSETLTFFGNDIGSDIEDPEWKIESNSWNTTLQKTRNMRGGRFIGGNYWTNTLGQGYSDLCDDADSDGICDQPFSINLQNIDYLPISSFIPLKIIVHSPINNRYYKNPQILINLTATDIRTDKIWFYNDSKMIIYNQESIISLNDGTYTYRFYANDSDGNIRYEDVTFFVDTTPPSIEISSPLNKTYVLSGDQFILFTINDINPVVKCTFWVNNKINNTIYSPNQSSSISFYLENSTINYSIRCTDIAANRGFSEKGTLSYAYCGDSICNNNETCSGCSGDCGSCLSGVTGSPGGGGGSRRRTITPITTINTSEEETNKVLEKAPETVKQETKPKVQEINTSEEINVTKEAIEPESTFKTFISSKKGLVTALLILSISSIITYGLFKFYKRKKLKK